jgi:hypothetical protein
MAWKLPFRDAIRAFPHIKVEPITATMRREMMAARKKGGRTAHNDDIDGEASEENDDSDGDRDDSSSDEEELSRRLVCEACGRGGHEASQRITLSGAPYDSFTFHNSERWDR